MKLAPLQQTKYVHLAPGTEKYKSIVQQWQKSLSAAGLETYVIDRGETGINDATEAASQLFVGGMGGQIGGDPHARMGFNLYYDPDTNGIITEIGGKHFNPTVVTNIGGDQEHVFNSFDYVSQALRHSANIARDEGISFGTAFSRVTQPFLGKTAEGDFQNMSPELQRWMFNTTMAITQKERSQSDQERLLDQYKRRNSMFSKGGGSQFGDLYDRRDYFIDTISGGSAQILTSPAFYEGIPGFRRTPGAKNPQPDSGEAWPLEMLSWSDKQVKEEKALLRDVRQRYLLEDRTTYQGRQAMMLSVKSGLGLGEGRGIESSSFAGVGAWTPWTEQAQSIDPHWDLTQLKLARGGAQNWSNPQRFRGTGGVLASLGEGHALTLESGGFEEMEVRSPTLSIGYGPGTIKMLSDYFQKAGGMQYTSSQLDMAFGRQVFKGDDKILNMRNEILHRLSQELGINVSAGGTVSGETALKYYISKKTLDKDIKDVNMKVALGYHDEISPELDRLRLEGVISGIDIKSPAIRETVRTAIGVFAEQDLTGRAAQRFLSDWGGVSEEKQLAILRDMMGRRAEALRQGKSPDLYVGNQAYMNSLLHHLPEVGGADPLEFVKKAAYMQQNSNLGWTATLDRQLTKYEAGLRKAGGLSEDEINERVSTMMARRLVSIGEKYYNGYTPLPYLGNITPNFYGQTSMTLDAMMGVMQDFPEFTQQFINQGAMRNPHMPLHLANTNRGGRIIDIPAVGFGIDPSGASLNDQLKMLGERMGVKENELFRIKGMEDISFHSPQALLRTGTDAMRRAMLDIFIDSDEGNGTPEERMRARALAYKGMLAEFEGQEESRHELQRLFTPSVYSTFQTNPNLQGYNAIVGDQWVERTAQSMDVSPEEVIRKIQSKEGLHIISSRYPEISGREDMFRLSYSPKVKRILFPEAYASRNAGDDDDDGTYALILAQKAANGQLQDFEKVQEVYQRRNEISFNARAVGRLMTFMGQEPFMKWYSEASGKAGRPLTDQEIIGGVKDASGNIIIPAVRPTLGHGSEQNTTGSRAVEEAQLGDRLADKRLAPLSKMLGASWQATDSREIAEGFNEIADAKRDMGVFNMVRNIHFAMAQKGSEMAQAFPEYGTLGPDRPLGAKGEMLQAGIDKFYQQALDFARLSKPIKDVYQRFNWEYARKYLNTGSIGTVVNDDFLEMIGARYDEGKGKHNGAYIVDPEVMGAMFGANAEDMKKISAVVKRQRDEFATGKRSSFTTSEMAPLLKEGSAWWNFSTARVGMQLQNKIDERVLVSGKDENGKIVWRDNSSTGENARRYANERVMGPIEKADPSLLGMERLVTFRQGKGGTVSDQRFATAVDTSMATAATVEAAVRMAGGDPTSTPRFNQDSSAVPQSVKRGIPQSGDTSPYIRASSAGALASVDLTQPGGRRLERDKWRNSVTQGLEDVFGYDLSKKIRGGEAETEAMRQGKEAEAVIASKFTTFFGSHMSPDKIESAARVAFGEFEGQQSSRFWINPQSGQVMNQEQFHSLSPLEQQGFVSTTFRPDFMKLTDSPSGKGFLHSEFKNINDISAGESLENILGHSVNYGPQHGIYNLIGQSAAATPLLAAYFGISEDEVRERQANWRSQFVVTNFSGAANTESEIDAALSGHSEIEAADILAQNRKIRRISSTGAGLEAQVPGVLGRAMQNREQMSPKVAKWAAVRAAAILQKRGLNPSIPAEWIQESAQLSMEQGLPRFSDKLSTEEYQAIIETVTDRYGGAATQNFTSPVSQTQGPANVAPSVAVGGGGGGGANVGGGGGSGPILAAAALTGGVGPAVPGVSMETYSALEGIVGVSRGDPQFQERYRRAVAGGDSRFGEIGRQLLGQGKGDEWISLNSALGMRVTRTKAGTLRHHYSSAVRGWNEDAGAGGGGGGGGARIAPDDARQMQFMERALEAMTMMAANGGGGGGWGGGGGGGAGKINRGADEMAFFLQSANTMLKDGGQLPENFEERMNNLATIETNPMFAKLSNSQKLLLKNMLVFNKLSPSDMGPEALRANLIGNNQDIWNFVKDLGPQDPMRTGAEKLQSYGINTTRTYGLALENRGQDDPNARGYKEGQEIIGKLDTKFKELLKTLDDFDKAPEKATASLKKLIPEINKVADSANDFSKGLVGLKGVSETRNTIEAMTAQIDYAMLPEAEGGALRGDIAAGLQSELANPRRNARVSSDAGRAAAQTANRLLSGIFAMQALRTMRYTFDPVFGGGQEYISNQQANVQQMNTYGNIAGAAYQQYSFDAAALRNAGINVNRQSAYIVQGGTSMLGGAEGLSRGVGGALYSIGLPALGAGTLGMAAFGGIFAGAAGAAGAGALGTLGAAAIPGAVIAGGAALLGTSMYIQGAGQDRQAALVNMVRNINNPVPQIPGIGFQQAAEFARDPGGFIAEDAWKARMGMPSSGGAANLLQAIFNPVGLAVRAMNPRDPWLGAPTEDDRRMLENRNALAGRWSQPFNFAGLSQSQMRGMMALAADPDSEVYRLGKRYGQDTNVTSNLYGRTAALGLEEMYGRKYFERMLQSEQLYGAGSSIETAKGWGASWSGMTGNLDPRAAARAFADYSGGADNMPMQIFRQDAWSKLGGPQALAVANKIGIGGMDPLTDFNAMSVALRMDPSFLSRASAYNGRGVFPGTILNNFFNDPFNNRGLFEVTAFGMPGVRMPSATQVQYAKSLAGTPLLQEFLPNEPSIGGTGGGVGGLLGARYTKNWTWDTSPFSLGLPVSRDARISQGFGENKDYYKQFGLDGHEGIDYAVPKGTDVRAAMSGVASVKSGTNYGNYITIKNRLGAETIYAHLSGFNIKDGQVVKEGEVIGSSGGVPGEEGAGNTTGAHLHFTARINGKYINPMWLFRTVPPQGGLAAVARAGVANAIGPLGTVSGTLSANLPGGVAAVPMTGEKIDASISGGSIAAGAGSLGGVYAGAGAISGTGAGISGGSIASGWESPFLPVAMASSGQPEGEFGIYARAGVSARTRTSGGLRRPGARLWRLEDMIAGAGDAIGSAFGAIGAAISPATSAVDAALRAAGTPSGDSQDNAYIRQQRGISARWPTATARIGADVRTIGSIGPGLVGSISASYGDPRDAIRSWNDFRGIQYTLPSINDATRSGISLGLSGGGLQGWIGGNLAKDASGQDWTIAPETIAGLNIPGYQGPGGTTGISAGYQRNLWKIQSRGFELQGAEIAAQRNYYLNYQSPAAWLGIRQQEASLFGGTVSNDWMVKNGIGPFQYMGQFPRERMQLGLQIAGAGADFSHQMTRFGWQLEDINRSQYQYGIQAGWQREDFALQAAGRQANRGYQTFEYQYGLQTLGIQQERATEDYAYNQQMRNLQHGWQQEDLALSIRRSTGFERRQLLRQQSREETTFNLETQHLEKQRSRQKEDFDREEAHMKKQREHALQMQKLEDKEFKNATERFEIQAKWKNEEFEREKERTRTQQGWAADDFGRQMKSFELRKQQLDEEEANARSQITLQEVLQKGQDEYNKQMSGISAERLENAKKEFQIIMNQKAAFEKLEETGKQVNTQVGRFFDDIFYEMGYAAVYHMNQIIKQVPGMKLLEYPKHMISRENDVLSPPPPQGGPSFRGGDAPRRGPKNTGAAGASFNVVNLNMDGKQIAQVVIDKAGNAVQTKMAGQYRMR